MNRRVLGLALALAATACGHEVRPPHRVLPSRVPVAVTSSAPAAEVPKPPVVSRFGAVNGLLSVEITNPNATLGVGPTAFVLKAYSATGTLLGTGGRGPLGDRCCTVFALPPGGRHGLYLELGAYATRVARVDVALVAPRWTRWTGGRAITVTDPHIESRSPAVAAATFSASIATDASVQAFLEDGDGHLVGVISAFVRCVGTTPREIPVSLYRAVPDGTRVGTVVAYPLPGRPRC